jgi:hypothetical protein
MKHLIVYGFNDLVQRFGDGMLVLFEQSEVVSTFTTRYRKPKRKDSNALRTSISASISHIMFHACSFEY